MTRSRRLRQLEDASAGPPPPTEEQACAALKAGTWTWSDWRVAVGDAQMAQMENWLLDAAVEARQRREAGERPFLGRPEDVAAEIVSYRPDEEVPAEYEGFIRRYLDGKRLTPGSATYFVHAGFAMLALKTPDGMGLRRRLWEEPEHP